MKKHKNNMDRLATPVVAFSLALASALFFSACSRGKDADGGGSAAGTLTIYSGQHESLAQALADAYEEHSGVRVRLRIGKDGELSNQIIEEGERSPADVLLTEEPGPVGDLGRRGLLVSLPDSLLASTDSRFVPADGSWLPWAARSRVFFYNPGLIAEEDLPRGIMELADPKWKGRFAYAPSGAFRSTTAHLINTIGREKTLAWLRAIKENGVDEQKNGKVRDAVEAGRYAFGLSNHYYWYILARNRGGVENMRSRVHFLNSDDTGALMLASGAGILRASKNRDAALAFLGWLISAERGQRLLSERSPQFPLSKGVESEYGLPSIDTLSFPEFNQSELNNVDEAGELLKQAGII